MTIPILAVNAEYGLTITKTCDVVATAFGDGYNQRSSFSPLMRSQVSFKGLSEAAANNLKTDFDTWKGVTSFYWRAKSSQNYSLFVAEDWSEEFLIKGYSTINASFVEQREIGVMPVQVLEPPILNLVPSNTSNLKVSYRNISNQFRQGYQQRGGDGLNTKLKTWSITANHLSDAEGDEIDAVLTSLRGATPFYWGDVATELYTCREWTIGYLEDNVQSFSGEFVQAFLSSV
ncbi:MAG: phage tail protein [Crinalium sp.]